MAHFIWTVVVALLELTDLALCHPHKLQRRNSNGNSGRRPAPTRLFSDDRLPSAPLMSVGQPSPLRPELTRAMSYSDPTSPTSLTSSISPLSSTSPSPSRQQRRHRRHPTNVSTTSLVSMATMSLNNSRTPQHRTKSNSAQERDESTLTSFDDTVRVLVDVKQRDGTTRTVAVPDIFDDSKTVQDLREQALQRVSDQLAPEIVEAVADEYTINGNRSRSWNRPNSFVENRLIGELRQRHGDHFELRFKARVLVEPPTPSMVSLRRFFLENSEDDDN